MIAELAQSLAKWTTDYHRRNVTQTVVFHAADRPADLANSSPGRTRSSKPCANRLRRRRSAIGGIHTGSDRSPSIGAAVIGRSARRTGPSVEREARPIEFVTPHTGEIVRFAARGHQAAPVVAGLQTPARGAQRHLVVAGRVLLVAHDAEPFAQWIVGTAGDVVTLNSDPLLQLTHIQYSEIGGTFDACVLFSGDAMLDQSDASSSISGLCSRQRAGSFSWRPTAFGFGCRRVQPEFCRPGRPASEPVGLD